LDITTQDRTTQSTLLWYWIIFGLIRFFMGKILFWYFRQLVSGTKSCVVVLWGSKISVFVLSFASSSFCPWNDLQIKRLTTWVVLYCPLFFEQIKHTLRIKKSRWSLRDYTLDFRYPYKCNWTSDLHSKLELSKWAGSVGPGRKSPKNAGFEHKKLGPFKTGPF